MSASIEGVQYGLKRRVSTRQSIHQIGTTEGHVATTDGDRAVGSTVIADHGGGIHRAITGDHNQILIAGYRTGNGTAVDIQCQIANEGLKAAVAVGIAGDRHTHFKGVGAISRRGRRVDQIKAEVGDTKTVAGRDVVDRFQDAVRSDRDCLRERAVADGQLTVIDAEVVSQRLAACNGNQRGCNVLRKTIFHEAFILLHWRPLS